MLKFLTNNIKNIENNLITKLYESEMIDIKRIVFNRLIFKYLLKIHTIFLLQK